jgi:broad specificity phosphatase PhoE
MQLILIKHARPLIDPIKPSHEWKLSEQGRADAAKLVEILRPNQIAKVYSSDEPKAIETAAIIAETLGVPTEIAADVHEHDRSNVPHMRSGEFISHVELFFRRPDELTLGRETANECLDRFESAINDTVQKHGQDNIAVVTHGTVLSLYLAKLGAGKPYEIWRKMGLPSYAIVDPNARRVNELVEKVG